MSLKKETSDIDKDNSTIEKEEKKIIDTDSIEEFVIESIETLRQEQ